ncbi:MAG TPA: stage II sporulation protein M [Solirubrobacteraceae bacterium]|nr:stage II sporulation protein M [Solirubrobacteraceae bacterium]
MKAEELALVQGWDDTRTALRGWRRQPARPLIPWSLGSLATAALLLVATWVIARLAVPDPSGVYFPGLYFPSNLGDYGFTLYRNGLVLALHGLACVAGFMAGSSLPKVAEGHTGVWRWVHDKAGPLAIAFVIAATLFSLTTQAYSLGHSASTLSAQLEISPTLLLLALAPHAVPELFALFLPLAAWTLASRRKAWNELLAATFVTVVIAVPILLIAAAIEVWISPQVLRALAGQ